MLLDFLVALSVGWSLVAPVCGWFAGFTCVLICWLDLSPLSGTGTLLCISILPVYSSLFVALASWLIVRFYCCSDLPYCLVMVLCNWAC
jgi:hypothetical protein